MFETAIKPLVHVRVEVPGGKVAFSAACFAGEHWTLSKLREPGDEMKNPTFAEEVGCALSGIGGKRAYAPNPTEFNGEIIAQKDLMFPLVLPYGVILYRNRLKPADGTFLFRPGDTGVFSAGGCGMMVVVAGPAMLFAHAGRESLLDREEVRSNGRSRKREKDLVDNLVEVLLALGMDLRDIYAWPMYFISPNEFTHRCDDPDPNHAQYNRGAIEFLPRMYPGACGPVDAQSISIDLPRIARAQFVRHGVPEENIFLEHAYLNKELPHTRKSKNGRYLVATVRE